MKKTFEFCASALLSMFLTHWTALASGPIYPLKASANGRYLVDQNNVPFLMVGDAPQSLIGLLSTTQANQYFVDRASKGFNAAWINLLCASYTYCSASGETYDGIAPFTAGSSPSNYDLSTPNATYFARVDTIINLAAVQGIVVLLDPIETGSWLTTLQNNGTAKAFSYGVYLGSRYKAFPNIVWVHGNDFQSWSTASDDNLVKQVMAGIASADSAHLQTIELDYYASYSNQDSSVVSFLGINGAYTYYETYDEVLKAYGSSPTLPIMLLEANYEFENNNSFFSGDTNAFILREQEYWAMLSGGFEQLYGNHYTVTSLWPTQGNLDTPGVTELGYFRAFFITYPWWLLVPDQSHSVVTAGFGSYNGANGNLPNATYCTTAATPDGTLVVTYCPNSTTLTVNLARMTGSTIAKWFDPSSGNSLPIAGSPFANTGSRQFTTPGTNSGGDKDWVLVLSASVVQTPAAPTSVTATVH